MKEFLLAKQDLMEAFSFMKDQVVYQSGQSIQQLQDQVFSSHFYLAEYLMGVCCDGLGEFEEAAHHFMNAIKHREHVEQMLADNSTSGREDLEKSLTRLEEQFFAMQLEAKKPVEKVLTSWTKGFNQYSTGVSNFSNMAIYNHNLMMGSDQPVLKSKPTTFFNLELLYIRAGISYYSGTFYSDAVPYLSKAIKLGEEYSSELVESSYYNRGLCYYYLGDLKKAVEDFSKSVSLMPLLKQREQPYLMRAATYGRLGMIKEKDVDVAKAKLVNPFSKSLPLFHLRLLNDDNLCLIMSFLQTKQLLVMSSLNRYSRNLVKQFLQEFDIEISSDSLYNKEINNNRSLVSKLFLPKDTIPPVRDILTEVMKNPFLVENSRNINVPYDSYVTNLEILYQALESFKNLKRLTVYDILDIHTVKKLISENSPNLSFIHIEKHQLVLDYFTKIVKLPSLEHIILPKVFFTSNPFEKNPSLKIVEYHPLTSDDMRRLAKGQNASKVLSWDKLKELNPNIIFKEHYPSFFPSSRKNIQQIESQDALSEVSLDVNL